MKEIYFETKGNLSSRGYYYLITGYFRSGRTTYYINTHINSSVNYQSINTDTTPLRKITTSQKRHLLKNTSLCQSHYFTYLYFDKRSITDHSIFEDKKQLQSELLKCFLQHWYMNNIPNFAKDINLYTQNEKILPLFKTLLGKINRTNNQQFIIDERKVGDGYEEGIIRDGYFSLIEDVIIKHQLKGKVSLYNLVPIINPIVINQSSFTKEGKIKPSIAKNR